jgi:hypothetical protein
VFEAGRSGHEGGGYLPAAWDQQRDELQRKGKVRGLKGERGAAAAAVGRGESAVEADGADLRLDSQALKTVRAKKF